ncbi:MAG: Glycosyl transferase family 2 [Parcubacteria group bacterium GW2011_GWC1_34_10]|uniref:Glycosyltransferase 2-like domain-containing protein n=1 Tax=Candidatus Zambryskibacteria bacterium RIFCSPLOWO2_01_FULL_35_19 TaxID=1802757 RepID=A0A1G2TV28_9BACT|nr:MAG: Glycosyl transferase family 2 [Parcubacteria group bacterium GW2011_GWC1_34_10]OHA85977.1 MAG: hypothetical protein A2726_01175 [Candidatus Zambryskibacteria bacterium RIFCSPHIGHO2_01_FULL_35_32]OHB01141.1 MAG: hypothetical protein A3A90_02765 [Candidatus Zambryskibacteria bacterium RIFCSPLOWO2_01_FULL_35_19]
MHITSEIITHIFLFIALYLEVFFLITYFESRDREHKLSILKMPKKWPSVSIIVPAWNEENTILKTIFSLLKINYPKDKLSIIVVDDGSTDNTWKVVQRFARNKQVKLLRKENGGKYTALNYALCSIDTELVGCLDADSYVHPEALKRIVAKFEDREMMAVTPSIKIFEPKGILGFIQKGEYIFGIFLKKVFYHLNALYITPGPFSIFRKSVFDKIGHYRHAYNTEDIEIAMRMQRNGLKIGNVHDAFVYTVAPNTIKTLFKQRLRWAYGFLQNAIDHRDMFFKLQYGHLGIIVLPAAGFSFFSTLYFFGAIVFDWFSSLIVAIKKIATIGLSFPKFNFDLFYINTNLIVFVSIIAVVGTIFMIVTARKLAEEKTKFGLDSILFILLYTLIAPFWMLKALYNVAFAKETKWR